MKALCDNVTQFSAAETLQKYQLGTSGNVNRIKTSLVNKEVVDITAQKIEFIDPLFKLWVWNSVHETVNTSRLPPAREIENEIGQPSVRSWTVWLAVWEWPILEMKEVH